mmetsp:Transcript_118101/g.345937  ORF Transcript_118101/g.345937 Transcript_118101/m.345937 type:complete len:131 (+) Transcript_118101:508-900(+)
MEHAVAAPVRSAGLLRQSAPPSDAPPAMKPTSFYVEALVPSAPGPTGPSIPNRCGMPTLTPYIAKSPPLAQATGITPCGNRDEEQELAHLQRESREALALQPKPAAPAHKSRESPAQCSAQLPAAHCQLG